MNSERLSQRVKQPGHDQTFRESEVRFVTAARAALDPDRYVVTYQPKELRDLFGRPGLGIQPEASIVSKATDRRFFVEVKKQGDRGNAEERACKHHTVQFYRTLHDRFGYDYHPYVTVFCEALAVNPRYTEKALHFFEPDQYLLWANYDQQLLTDFLRARCAAWIDG